VGSATVTNNSGQFAVTNEITHLSAFNWDWWLDYTCVTGARLHFTSNTYKSGIDLVPVNLKVFSYPAGIYLGSRIGWNNYYDYIPVDVFDGSVYVQMQYVPSISVVFEAEDNYQNPLGAQVVMDLCTGDHNIELTPPQLPPSDSLIVYIYGFCPNSLVDTIFPNIGFYYRNLTKMSDWTPGYVIHGKCTLHNMIHGDNYRWSLFLNGVYYEKDTIFNPKHSIYFMYEINFPGEVCDEIQ
jgi:hypothetical protein